MFRCIDIVLVKVLTVQLGFFNALLRLFSDYSLRCLILKYFISTVQTKKVLFVRFFNKTVIMFSAADPQGSELICQIRIRS